MSWYDDEHNDDADDDKNWDDDGHSSVCFRVCKQITCTIPESPKTKWNEWQRKWKVKNK